MGEPYLFPAQEDRCACCYRTLDTRPNGEVWRTRALPWVFCSQACIHDYIGKDGEVPTEPTAPKEKTT